ncbi:cytochrome c [Sphingobium yanoikuyae]|jgi:mono/diheme cytochrome c family protein|uniref:Cytochrome c n=1 Tax=Sphingobium yanoikuyae TaxID=13690 RepID=A0A6P1GLQ3_SPHYA|nr:cytochrome c [Sphingobium yanoikuyae]
MKRYLALGALPFMATALIAGAPKQKPVLNSASGSATGQMTFDRVCGRCHTTNVGPEIRGRQLPADYIKMVVRHGNAAMPAFTQAQLDDKALDSVAQLVAASKMPSAPVPQQK